MPILPIVTYNDPLLRKEAEAVDELNEEVSLLIADMFETMYNSHGVGLAAPQIGKSLQLFVMDADTMTEELDDEEDLGAVVFINPQIVKTEGEWVKMEEGCLSIPDIRDDVSRHNLITVTYRDRDFEQKTQEFSGWASRVIQHEYDHLKGVLFLDHLSSFRRRFHRFALKKIDSGKLETEYPLVPKKVKKGR